MCSAGVSQTACQPFDGLPKLSAVADAMPYSLVLGMAFVTPAEAEQAQQGCKGGTSSAIVRDRARLLELQKNFNVLTFNW